MPATLSTAAGCAVAAACVHIPGVPARVHRAVPALIHRGCHRPAHHALLGRSGCRPLGTATQYVYMMPSPRTPRSDSEPRGVINLAECTLREDWAGSRSHSFKLIEGGEINGGVGKGNPSMLAAESEADKQQWIQLIQGVTRDHGHDRSKE
jgi:hypothetical protein